MSHRISHLFSAALLLPAVASHAASDDSTQMLEPVVVTASRTAQPLKAVIGDVTVIGRKALERFSGESVLSALQGQSGVQVATNGGAGKTSAVFLRGANSSHTLVLIDGVRYGSATGGAAALEHIPADQIERIEILRGAAASLYGSDAIGGVIQIFTRQGKNAPQASLQLGYGTQDTRQASLNVSGQQGSTHASLTVAHAQTDSVSAISNRKNSNYFADTDGYENSSISAKLTHELAGGHQVGGSVLWSDNQGQYDASTYDFATNTSGAQHYNYRNDSENGAAQLWAQLQLSEQLQTRVQAGYSTDDGKSYSPTSATHLADQLSLFRTVQEQYVWQNELSLPNGKTTWGAEYLEQRIQSTEHFPTRDRDIKSLLAGYMVKLNTTDVQANIRHDDNSQYGSEATYSLAISQPMGQGWSTGVAHGTGFRAPSFNELYYPFYGVATLKPEKSRNDEVFLRYQGEQFRSRLTVFRNEVKNLIQYDASIFAPNNIGEAQLQGVSLSLDGSLSPVHVGGNYDYLDATDQSGLATDGRKLARRAKHSGMVYFGVTQGTVQARAELQAVGSRYDNAANTVQLAKYTLVNLSGSVKLSPELSLGLRINNLFDENYETIKNYGTVGLNGLVTLTYSPKR